MKTKVNTEKLKKLIEDYDLNKSSRLRELVWNRSAVCTFLRKYGYSFQQIGDLLRKNHATIIHNISIYENNIKYDDFQDYIKPIQIDLNKCLMTDMEHLVNRFSPFEIDFLRCDKLSDYKKLKEQLLKKTTVSIDNIEENIFTTFDI